MSLNPSDTLMFDRHGIRAVDRLAIERHGISGLELMERAAKGAADIAAAMVSPEAHLLIVSGSGNNGGDGWAMARLLHERGCRVDVLAPKIARPGSDAAVNEQLARDMPIPVHTSASTCPDTDLVIDALLGTGLQSRVTGDTLDLIDWINALGAPALALDIPSGLDADSGRPRPRAVRALATATFVGLKVGMLQTGADAFTGTCHVIDIGVPRSLAESLSLDHLDT